MAVAQWTRMDQYAERLRVAADLAYIEAERDALSGLADFLDGLVQEWREIGAQDIILRHITAARADTTAMAEGLLDEIEQYVRGEARQCES